MRRPFDHALTEHDALQRELVRYATLAPSSHNSQCWKFELDRNQISIRPDFARRLGAVDPDNHELFASLGCATENFVQAAAANGLHSAVTFEPARGGSVRIATEPARTQASALFDAIPLRQCTRGPYDGEPLALSELRELQAGQRADGVRIVLLTARPQLERVLEYVVEGDTIQLNDPAFMDELRGWIRFSDAEAIATGDGLSTRSSGQPSVPRWLGTLGMKFAFTPQSQADTYAKLIRSSAGIAVFLSDTSDKPHWVAAGRCYQRFVLRAASMGIRTSMLNQAVEVSALMRERFAASLGLGSGRPDLVVRFGRGPEMPRSLRRPVDAVIV
jgi:hypothetical protein